MHTDINVVVLTYKPDDKFFMLLDGLNRQTVPVKKVIIMNTDEQLFPHEEFKLRYSNAKASYEIEVRHVKKSEFDHAGTRNEGASYADDGCDILIFMTMDAIPSDDKLIENIIKPFEMNKVGASYARQLAGDKSPLMEKFTRSFNYPDEPHIKGVNDIERLGIKAFFCSNVCCAYRMSVFKELCGFQNRAIFNEDMVFANKLIKAGYLIAYASDACVIHTHEYNGIAQFKRNFDLAVSQKMNPDVFSGVSSEKEGVKYVVQAFKYFCKNKKPWIIFPFAINCACKYAGYRTGLNFEKLPQRKLLKYSNNPEFFNKTDCIKQ